MTTSRRPSSNCVNVSHWASATRSIGWRGQAPRSSLAANPGRFSANLRWTSASRWTCQISPRCLRWLEEQLNGAARVGLPWPSLLAFMRISTSLRMASTPITGRQAWGIIQAWLESPVAWIPSTTPRHVEIFAGLVDRYEISGNMIPDAHLATYAIEHGMSLASADTDFARFGELRWINPVAPIT